MDSNGFYYTLSTISQTLAGFFGLLIAVVTFHIQRIRAEMSLIPRFLENYHKNSDDMKAEMEQRIEVLRKEETGLRREETALTEQIDDLNNNLTTFVSQFEQADPSMARTRGEELRARTDEFRGRIDELLARRNELSTLRNELGTRCGELRTQLNEYGSRKIAEAARCKKDLKDMANLVKLMERGLRHSLTYTVWTIGLCLFTLPWVNYILVSWLYYVSGVWLLLVVGLAIYCLTTYVPLVLSLIDDTDIDIEKRKPWPPWFGTRSLGIWHNRLFPKGGSSGDARRP